MSNIKILGDMVNDIFKDYSQLASAWQLIILALCLSVSWFLSKQFERFLSRRHLGERSLTVIYAESSLKKAAFPVFAWLLVLAAQWILPGYIKTNVLKLASVFLLGLGALYVAFFMARRVLGVSSGAVHMVKLVEKGLTIVIWVGMPLYVLGVWGDVLNWLDSIVFTFGHKQKLSLLTILNGCVWVFLTIVIALFVSSMLTEKLKRAKDLEPNFKEVLARLIRVLLVVLALIIGLSIVGIDLTVLSVFGGAFVVAVGLGLQKIASNYISGFVILLDRSLHLGCLISVDQITGVVTQIRTRYTVLRAPDDTEVLVPNEQIIASMVKNYSYSQKNLRLAVRVQASYKSEPEDVIKVLSTAANNIPRILRHPAPSAFLVHFEDSGILYELGFWIDDPEEGRLGVQSAVNLAIWRAFREHGIEIPYPQRELRMIG